MKNLISKNNIEYCVMTSMNDGELFYGKLGRFFCDKTVTQEMGGYQVVDGPDRIWIVAMDCKKAVGFSSFSIRDIKKQAINLCDSYVDPEYRKRGIYKTMFGLREQELRSYVTGYAKIKGIALRVSEKMFCDNGYIKASQRGRFAYMVKEIEI